jgi:hypothetical protein
MSSNGLLDASTAMIHLVAAEFSTRAAIAAGKISNPAVVGNRTIKDLERFSLAK